MKTSSKKSEGNKLRVFAYVLIFLAVNVFGIDVSYADSARQSSISLSTAEEEATNRLLFNIEDAEKVSISRADDDFKSLDSAVKVLDESEITVSPITLDMERDVSDEITFSVEGESVSLYDDLLPIVFNEAPLANELETDEAPPAGGPDSGITDAPETGETPPADGLDSGITDAPETGETPSANEPIEKSYQHFAAAPATPDYVVSNIASSGAYPYPALGTSVFSITVDNIGNASSSANIRCAAYIDGNSVGTFYLSPIAASTSVTFNMSLNNIPEGTHSVTITANDNAGIGESSLSNNSLTKSFNWTGTPDLSVSSFKCTTASPTVGMPVAFEFQVSNTGNGMASGRFYTDIVIDGVHITTIAISNLGAMQVATGGYNLQFVEKKAYNLSMTADCNKYITESNESNNARTLSLTNIRISPNITIRGTLEYGIYNRADLSSPIGTAQLENYLVRIYDAATQTLKNTVRTNSQGAFTATVTNNTANDGCNIYIEIPMENNSYARIMPVSLPDAYLITSNTVDKVQKPVLDLGTIALDVNDMVKGAMNIYHWIKFGKDEYTSKANSGSVGIIDVKWGASNAPGSKLLGETMYLDGGTSADQYDPAVILHEYGHYIMQHNSRWPIDGGGNHDWVNPSLGAFGTNQNGTAYSEGYAHFISTQLRGGIHRL